MSSSCSYDDNDDYLFISQAWGAIPDRLQLLHVKVMPAALCELAVKEAQGDLQFPPVNHKVEICTIHEKGYGHGMCHVSCIPVFPY